MMVLPRRSSVPRPRLATRSFSLKGHGWSQFTNADLIRRTADHIAANAPAGASSGWYPADPADPADPDDR